jgi:hypothetical protein
MFAVLGINQIILAGLVAPLLIAACTAVYRQSKRAAALRTAVTAIVGLILGSAFVALLSDGSGNSSNGTPTASRPTVPADTTPIDDEDEDGVRDSVDECLGEVGIEPSGCPDGDGDKTPDPRDRCPTTPTATPDGCPPVPVSSGLEKLANENRIEFPDENASISDEVLLKGHPPAKGVLMGIGTAYDDAAIAILANGQYQTLRGRVALTPETCPGEHTTLAVRDESGRTIWKKAADSDPVPLNVRIASLGRIELYAQATGESHEDCYINGTTVGWIGIRLVGST